MKPALPFLTCFLAILWLPAASAQAAVPEFDTVADAYHHCPYDTVMRIDSKSTAFRNQNTLQQVKPGYVCKNEAVYGGYGGLVTHLKPVPQPAR